MATIIEMPKLSDTMSVGTVVKWHKVVGDAVANGDTLAEIETDKATMELENGILCQFNSSWTVRVRRDDLFVMQVDGSKGSAVVNLRGCQTQGLGVTPKPVWNPDIEQPIDFFAGWSEMPDATTYDNAFKIQWELFLRHVALDEPFPYDLRSGAKGVELAEIGIQSWEERKWIDL